MSAGEQSGPVAEGLPESGLETVTETDKKPLQFSFILEESIHFPIPVKGHDYIEYNLSIGR